MDRIIARIEEIQRELSDSEPGGGINDDDSDDSDYQPSSDEDDTDTNSDVSVIDVDALEDENDDIEFLGINLAPNPAIPALVAPALAQAGGR